MTLRTVVAAAAVAAGTALSVGVAAADSPADTADDIPALPELRGVDGSAGSLVNRNLGTEDQAFCAKFGEQLADLAQDWEDARQAAAEAHRDGNAAAVAGARATANTLRFTFANVNAANVQCLTAADAALTSSQGSVSGSASGSVSGSLPVQLS